MKTMLIQNFEVINKEHYGISWSGQLPLAYNCNKIGRESRTIRASVWKRQTTKYLDTTKTTLMNPIRAKQLSMAATARVICCALVWGTGKAVGWCMRAPCFKFVFAHTCTSFMSNKISSSTLRVRWPYKEMAICEYTAIAREVSKVSVDTSTSRKSRVTLKTYVVH